MAKPRIPNQKAKYTALNKRLAKRVYFVDNLLEDYCNEAALIAKSVGYDGTKPFSFNDYPTARKRLKTLLSRYRNEIRLSIRQGILGEWKASNEVQDILAEKVLSAYGVSPSSSRYRKYFLRNISARKAFMERNDDGVNIQSRLYNQSNAFAKELECAISAACRSDMGTGTLAKAIIEYIDEPDKLRYDFKKRHNKEADIKDVGYHARRLARSEINMAYRNAEHERWEQLDFVVGYEIKLSSTHHDRMPKGDICDILAGKYPKYFKWTGWHPNDLCYCIPILKTEDEFFGDDETPSKNEVTELPKAYKEWLQDNKGRLDDLDKRNKLPYFVKENESYKDEPSHKGNQSLLKHKPTKHGELQQTIPNFEVILDKEQEENIKELGKILGMTEEEANGIKPMSFDEADAQMPNALNARDNNVNENCQICTPVFEMRCRGLNVTANGYDKAIQQILDLSNDQTLAYIDPKTGEKPKLTFKCDNQGALQDYLTNQTAKNGRYEIGFTKMQGSEDGHVLSFIKADGKLYFYDGQSGERVDINEYYPRINYEGGVTILRVDKLLINVNMANIVTML